MTLFEENFCKKITLYTTKKKENICSFVLDIFPLSSELKR